MELNRPHIRCDLLHGLSGISSRWHADHPPSGIATGRFSVVQLGMGGSPPPFDRLMCSCCSTRVSEAALLNHENNGFQVASRWSPDQPKNVISFFLWGWPLARIPQWKLYSEVIANPQCGAVNKWFMTSSRGPENLLALQTNTRGSGSVWVWVCISETGTNCGLQQGG